MKKYSLLVLSIIIALATLLRFYKLEANPPGLYWDEVSLGYNAYSILETGKDEHGQFLPLTFKAFGEYKLPIYIYATAFSIALFDLSELAVRFPSALAGVLTVILTYFLILKLFKSRRLAVASSLLLAISPWHIQFSRAAFEANLALFFLVAATFLFLKAAGRPLFLLPSSLLFSLTLYTYSSARLFTPIFILCLVVFWGKSFRPKKEAYRLLVFFLIIFSAAYLALFFLPNLMTRFNVVAAFHGYHLSQWPSVFLKNYLLHFSFDFLFFQGDQMARHGMEKMGNLYFFEIPLVLIGLYQLAKIQNQKAKLLIFTWLFLAPLASSLTNPSPHSLRSLNMIIPLMTVSGLGLLQIIDWAKRQIGTFLRRAFFYLSMGMIMLYFFLNYLHFYFVHYPKTSGLAWQEGNKEMAQEVLKRAKHYDRILVSDFLGQTYIYLLFYGKIDPNFYQISRTSDGFNKYHLIGKGWPQKPPGKTLWVLSFDDKFTPEGKLLGQIKIANGDTIYRLWETE